MSESKLISVDLGNGFIKARSAARQTSFPSVLAVESMSIDFDIQNSASDFIIGYQGKRYTLGDTVHYKGQTPITITHRSRIETDFYKVMFAGAMSAVLKNSATVSPVVSLPPGMYWDKEKQKENLAGVYTVEVPDERGKFKTLTYNVPIELIRAIPEGLGTICTFTLDQKGNEADSTLFNNVVGVLDVGTYTTDVILLDRLKIVRNGTDSIKHALNDIHTALKNYASGKGYDLDSHKADEVMRQGWFRKDGQREPVGKQVNGWAEQLAAAASGLIRSKWNGGDDVDYIIVTGGGGDLVYPFIKREFNRGNIERVFLVEEDPHFANCEGGFRYGLLKERAAQNAR